jgi:hypothetical protein
MNRQLTLKVKDPETLVLSGLDDFLVELVRRIPADGAPHPDSDERLFPAPSRGREPEMDAEWVDFVRPELEEQFGRNRDRVTEDLHALRKQGPLGMELEIPQRHVPSWVHALNQARLSLVARHKISDEALEDSSFFTGPQGLVLFQIQFYGLLQEWLIEAGQAL